ncbi:transposase [Paraburkholderia terrae]
MVAVQTCSREYGCLERLRWPEGFVCPSCATKRDP